MIRSCCWKTMQIWHEFTQVTTKREWESGTWQQQSETSNTRINSTRLRDRIPSPNFQVNKGLFSRLVPTFASDPGPCLDTIVRTCPFSGQVSLLGQVYFLVSVTWRQYAQRVTPSNNFSSLCHCHCFIVFIFATGHVTKIMQKRNKTN